MVGAVVSSWQQSHIVRSIPYCAVSSLSSLSRLGRLSYPTMQTHHFVVVSPILLKPRNILHIFMFWFVYQPQPRWVSVILQWSTNAGDKHRSCMWFQCPPYWDTFLLFQWARLGQYSSPCNENRLTFPELSAINQRTVVMVVGGGTWTAGPWNGGPSNSGNKRWKPGARFYLLWICTICTICILQCAEYAQYASMKFMKIRIICMIICKKICMQ